LTQVSLGNGLTETRAYNLQRTWLNSLSVGSVYSFAIPTFDGNGNVLTANDNTNGNWTYQYDGVNRLKTATIGGQNFNYSYTADGSNGQFGNMTCAAPSGTTYSCTPLGLSFNQANNQINSSGYSYDGAGNLLTDNTHGYVYDLENRVTCVLGQDGTCTSNTATLYLYDAAGQRVGKQQANTLEDYVYDPQGHITSDYNNGSATPFRAEIYTPQGRHVATWNPGGNYGSLFFNHTDWLGTHRVRTDSNGTAREWCTDTPYGMNLACTPPDVSPMHFTGKQRDSESGNDYCGARYYTSNTGRWMSSDRPFADQLTANPQSWNLYSYTRNNPLASIDTDGRVVRTLTGLALQRVQSTLPANVRSQITADNTGLLDRTAIDAIKSDDSNVKLLQQAVDADRTIEVTTGPSVQGGGPEGIVGMPFSYQSVADQQAEVKAAVWDPSGITIPSVYDGYTQTPDISPSGNVRVTVADGKGATATEPAADLASTTAHELYGHALRFVKGQPYKHDNGGPVDKDIKSIEDHTKKLNKDPQ
jgi:RHS repeat-associated protein